jgi:alpha-L-fucosidase
MQSTKTFSRTLALLRGFTAIGTALLAWLPTSAHGQSGPDKTAAVVAAANAAVTTPLPDVPFQPIWDSIRQNYKMPQWFIDAKFGLFMHWS